MNDNLAQSPKLDRKRGVKRVLLEAVLVAMIGAGFAIAANELSPRGLALRRNYFPGGPHGSVSTSTARDLSHGAGGTNQPTSAQLLAVRLKEKGLQLIDGSQVAQLLQEPRYRQDLIVFVDARDDEHYQQGHIPGAYGFDRYHPEKYFAAVFPICQAAEQVVVYCNGGDCEDSEFAAIMLQDAGIPGRKLFVYAGGITEWNSNGSPVELGVRNSGNLSNASK